MPDLVAQYHYGIADYEPDIHAITMKTYIFKSKQLCVGITTTSRIRAGVYLYEMVQNLSDWAYQYALNGNMDKEQHIVFKNPKT